MPNTNESDHVLVLHTPDGAEWARFLAARLHSPSYNINSLLIDITNTPEPSISSPSPSSPQESSSSLEIQNKDSSTNQDEHDEEALYTNEGELPSEDSIYTNNATIESNNNIVNTKVGNNEADENSSPPKTQPRISQSIDACRACAIFISPDIVENENAFNIDVSSLNQRRTVFLYLGVDLPEVMQYFGPLYDRVSGCRCCFVDGTPETIRSGIVSIIEAYEDDEEDAEGEDDSLYNVPNQPIQVNTIDKVFPRMLTETEREVYVLLSRIPEDCVQVVLIDNAVTLPLTLVCEKLYSFVLPPNVYGEVIFQLECQGRRFGQESVHSYSKLDLIQHVLTSELNPQSLIAASLGLDKDDIGGLDTALAFKLQELAPVMTFKMLCPCEEALRNNEEQSDKMWPTLLHFAAEFNLRLLCSELLRYPGMVAAACTENRAGEFPCQIANKKGYFLLENDLIEFMKRLRREVDPDYVSSSQCNLSSSRESSTASLSESSATGPLEDTGVYFDMSETQRLRKPLLDVTKRSLSGRSPSRAPVRTQSDRSDASSGRISYSHRPLPRRPDSPTDDSTEDTYSNPDDSPQSIRGSPTSQKALKRLGATEEEVAARYSVLDPKTAATANFYSATCPPGTLRARLFEDENGISVSSNYDGRDLGWSSSTVDPKRGQMKEKVKGFFQKIKGSKKTGNPPDLSGKKNSGSKPRRGSEPANVGKIYSKTSGKTRSFDEERDSGSYSDEEKKPKVFKASNKPMTRRVSRRIEYARKESYGPGAPELPSYPEDKRATFRSFIQ